MQRNPSLHRHLDMTANFLRRQFLDVAPEAMLAPERDCMPFADRIMND